MGSHNSKGGHPESNPKNESTHNPFTTYVPSVSNSIHSTTQPQTSVESRTIDKNLDSSNYVNTVFRWNYGGNEVFVTGTFTNWQNHVRLQKNGNEFSVILQLSRAIHRYKFIVDDEWRFSPDDSNSPDENGYINNIIDTTDYNGTTSFNYPGQSSIGTSFKFLNNTISVTRGTTTLSTDQRPSMNINTSVETLKATKFFEDEMEFVKEAPFIPPQLLDIYYISEKDKKIKDGWSKGENGIEIEQQDGNRSNKTSNDGIFRALESFNALSPPTHVILNHLGVKKQNQIEGSYFTYVITERFKAKYVTMKFYTSQTVE